MSADNGKLDPEKYRRLNDIGRLEHIPMPEGPPRKRTRILDNPYAWCML